MEKKVKDNLIDDQLESQYFIKHHEMEKLEKKSFILQSNNIKDQKFVNFLLNSKKKRHLNQKLQKSSFFSFFYLKYLVFKNPNILTHLLIELNSNIIIHPILTLKTRIQSKNNFHDICNYVKNNVEKKSVFLGLRYSYLISAIQCTFFGLISKINQTSALKQEYQKTIAINLMISDVLSSPLRNYLELKRMLSQMASESIKKNIIGKYRQIYPVFLIRDLTFRFLFYGLNFEYITNMNQNKQTSINFLNFIIASFFTSLILSPLDVVSTKLATQESNYYKSIKDCFKLVLKEEKILKFYSGFSFRFLTIVVSGTLNLLFYKQFNNFVKEVYTIDSLLD